jgi:Cu-Zn family superoxide dismutase
VSLLSKSNSKVTGTVTLTEEDDGVKVAIQLANAKPGDHGMHIHEKADCSAPDAKSAGDHFNPEKHDHGMPDGDKRHLGDLGNISVDKDGTGTAETKVKGANLKPDDPMSFLRRSLIVHEKKDDGKTQPSGNSGARIACAELQQGGGPADEAAGTDKAQTKPANANTATDKAAADKASSSGANPSGKAKPPAR